MDPGIEAMETENGPVTVDQISRDLLECQRQNLRNSRRCQAPNSNRGQGRGLGGQMRGGQSRGPHWNPILSGRQTPLFPEQGARSVSQEDHPDRPPIDERLNAMADPYLGGARGFGSMGNNQGPYGNGQGGVRAGYFGCVGLYAEKARGQHPLPCLCCHCHVVLLVKDTTHNPYTPLY